MPIIGVIDSSKSGNLYSASFDSIATTTVGAGGASSITFNSIPSGYTHLQIRGIARTTEVNEGTNGVFMQFNGVSSTSYDWHYLVGTGDGAVGSASINVTGVYGGLGPRAQMTANVFAGQVIDILDYANTNKNKTVRTLSGVDYNGTPGGRTGFIGLYTGQLRSTNAITSITIYPEASNFAQFTRFALYGIKVA